MEKKRYLVQVVVGCNIDPASPPCLIYDYEHRYFDTYEEATKFASGFPKEHTNIWDVSDDTPF